MHKILGYEQINETEVGALHVKSFSKWLCTVKYKCETPL